MIVRSDNLSDLTPEQRRLMIGAVYVNAQLAAWERRHGLSPSGPGHHKPTALHRQKADDSHSGQPHHEGAGTKASKS